MSVIDKAVNWALNIARDDTHGYDQVHRWGKDYDCSALIISAFEQAGAPVKSKGAIYTGNMRTVFLSCGFEDVTKFINLATGAGLQRGDVLLRHNYTTDDGHTALALGDGRIVHASSNELGKATGGKTGDQTGTEICVRSYYNSNPKWDYVLRYKEATAKPTTPAAATTPQPAPVLVALPPLVVGSTGKAVENLQHLLNAHGAVLATDGDFGAKTLAAVKGFQEKHKLEADGEVGPLTWRALITE